MAQQTPSLRDKGYKQHLDQAIALSTAFIKDTEGHTPTKEEVLQRLQEQQLTSSKEGLALWAHLNKQFPDGLRERAVSAVNARLS
jgi:hypothetical protein